MHGTETEEAMWHRDFPTDAREVWDVMAKALMMRFGGHALTLSADELRAAAAMQGEIQMNDDGSIDFRTERH